MISKSARCEETTVSRVLFSETAGASRSERELVAGVINNRVGHAGFANGSLKSACDVVTQPGAFEALNDPRNTNWAKSGNLDSMNKLDRATWNSSLGVVRAGNSTAPRPERSAAGLLPRSVHHQARKLG